MIPSPSQVLHKALAGLGASLIGALVGWSAHALTLGGRVGALEQSVQTLVLRFDAYTQQLQLPRPQQQPQGPAK